MWNRRDHKPQKRIASLDSVAFNELRLLGGECVSMSIKGRPTTTGCGGHRSSTQNCINNTGDTRHVAQGHRQRRPWSAHASLRSEKLTVGNWETP
jgi:hypothetical protein